MALLDPPAPTIVSANAEPADEELIEAPAAVTAWSDQQSATRRHFHRSGGPDRTDVQTVTRGGRARSRGQ